MKRLSHLGFVGVLASFLAGCPVYGDGPGDACGPGGCGSGGHSPGGCNSPADCQQNETCGDDNQCHPGDCFSWGCPNGFTCEVDPDTNTASCVPGGSSGTGGSGGTGGTGAGGSTGGTGGTGGSGGSAVYCGNPADCSPTETCTADGTCKPGDCKVNNGCIYGWHCNASDTCEADDPNACGADAQCEALGEGYACVAGQCTQPADQCSDQTQCPAGDKCAAGKCTMACAADADCKGGYGCDTQLGLCTKPLKTCTITNDCGGPDTVCVDGACVPRSSGPTCDPGDVWVQNGCLPDQAAIFFCATDGQQDVCAAGSLCLHHNCYISCESPNEAICDSLPSINVCKPVTTSSGDHAVCGTDQNLGSECDPTANKPCLAGQICIDGYCK